MDVGRPPVQDAAVANEYGSRRATIPAAGGLPALLASPDPPADAVRRHLAVLPPAAVPGLLKTIAYHRIEGLAHRALARLPHEAVDPWLRAALKRRRRRLAAAALVQGLALAEILEALRRARLEVIVMRGLRITELVYGEPGLRPFEDHDLLVPSDAVDSARTTLQRLGFEACGPSVLRRGGMLIDLHTDPLGATRRPSRAALFPVSTPQLFARAEPGRVAGAPALLLPIEDEVLLIAVHLVKHSFDRLIRLADLSHLTARHGRAIRWETVRRRAAASGTVRLVGWALEAATLLGGVPAPPGWRSNPRDGWLARLLMQRVGALRPAPYSGEILMALAAGSAGGAWSFLMDALLPAAETPVGIWPRAAAAPGRVARLVRQAAGQVEARRNGR